MCRYLALKFLCNHTLVLCVERCSINSSPSHHLESRINDTKVERFLYKCIGCEYAISYARKRREYRFRGTRHWLGSGRLISREVRRSAGQNWASLEEGKTRKAPHPQEYLSKKLYGDGAPIVLAQLRKVELAKSSVKHLAEAKANLLQLKSTLQKSRWRHRAGPGAVPEYSTDFWPNTQMVLEDYKRWVKETKKVQEHDKAYIGKRIAETLGRNDLKVISRGPSSTKLCPAHGAEAYTDPYQHTRAAEQHEELGLFPVKKYAKGPSTRIVKFNGDEVPSFLVAGLGEKQFKLRRKELAKARLGRAQSSFHPVAFARPSPYYGPYQPYRPAEQKPPVTSTLQRSPPHPVAPNAETSIQNWLLYSQALLPPTAELLDGNPVHSTPLNATMDSQKNAISQPPAPRQKRIQRKSLPPNAKVSASTCTHLRIPLPCRPEIPHITPLSLNGFPFEGLAQMISTALSTQRLL